MTDEQMNHKKFNRESDKPKLERMMKWLKKGGAKVDKVKIETFRHNYRGVVATQDISKGE